MDVIASSGPNRYDWDPAKRVWVNTRDGHRLASVLRQEWSKLFGVDVQGLDAA